MFRALLITGVAVVLAYATPAQAGWFCRHNRIECCDPCVTTVVTPTCCNSTTTYYVPQTYYVAPTYSAYGNCCATPVYYCDPCCDHYSYRSYRSGRWCR